MKGLEGLLTSKKAAGQKNNGSGAENDPNSAERPSTAGTTRDRSRPTSMYPDGDFRNGPRESVMDIKADVMVSYLHQQQLERMWANGAPGEGVILKKSKGNFTCFPTQLETDPGGLFEAVKAMNIKVCACS
jgi:hypothetical protein